MSNPQLDQEERARLIGFIFAEPNWYRTRPCATLEGVPEFDLQIVEMQRQYPSGHWRSPLIFPRRDKEGDSLTWYACAQDESEYRSLVQEMQAFVGPSFSDFTAERASLDQEDAIEASLTQVFENRVLRFRSVTLADRKGAVRQINSYFILRRTKPALAVIRTFGLGTLRSRFDRALFAKSAEEARTVLSMMKSLRLLSAENALFLEVRFLAGLERWDELLELKLFPQLVSLKLPRETLADVIEALYRRELQPIEFGGGLDDLLSATTAELFARYPLLFRTRSESQRPSVLKAFLLRAMSQADPDAGFINDLFGAIPRSAWSEPESSKKFKGGSLATGIVRPWPVLKSRSRTVTLIRHLTYFLNCN